MTTPAAVAAYWDNAAATFDAEADHGLRSPAVRAAWAGRFVEWIPDDGVDVLDVGCGTGSLALLLAQQGHHVTGVDLSPAMVDRARAKLAGHDATIVPGDATEPPVRGPFDVVVCRHLLWTLPRPTVALRRWVSLLRPGGQLVLIEGHWNPGAANDGMPWWNGVSSDVLAAALGPLVARLYVDHLTDAAFWGHEIADERYALLAHV